MDPARRPHLPPRERPPAVCATLSGLRRAVEASGGRLELDEEHTEDVRIRAVQGHSMPVDPQQIGKPLDPVPQWAVHATEASRLGEIWKQGLKPAAAVGAGLREGARQEL